MTSEPTLLQLPRIEPRDNPLPLIHELFERQVRATPEAIAISFEERQLTYEQLNRRANQLAHALRQRGVGPEIPVALYLERSIDMVIAIIAVLKAGGAYVPIDLAYPPDRAAFMLADAQAPLLLTQQKLLQSLPPQAITTLCLDSEWETISRESDENPVSRATAENMAYIIYTSGSTGKPKGVVITHGNVVRLLTQTQPWYGFNARDVWSLFHSYAFDVSVYEIWGALFHGGRLVVVPYLVSRTPSAFYELLAKEGVTVLSQTPSAFRQLIRAEAEADNKFALSLRYVICAGEALELQSLKPWFDLHGDDQPLVVNMYGITETTVHSMYRPIRKADLANGSGSVIGVAIPDLQIHLLNENLQPVPPGVPGEICVGGAGVARGYLNRPELTRERFVPDPFSSQPEAILYRSGDLAQISAAGEMEYLGRMDHQVKIRGFRIELGEIESALNQHPALRESAVVVDQSSGVKRLAAYLVATRQTPTITELRETLAQKLPDYMIPTTFTFLGSLPLTTNGKLDRRALPAPDHARPSLKDDFVAPSTDKERTLATIWSEVLEISPVGIHDNFFELGGDSIRSIAVLSRAAKAGLHLTLQQLFQKPRIAQLSDCAASGLEPDANAPISPFALISPEDRAALPATAEDAYPLTTLQLGMFFHNELDPLSAIYHDVFSYRIESVFDLQKLQHAMEELAARHPVLRTSFHLAGFSKPLQVVHSQVNVPFTVEDLRGLNVETQDQKLVDWVDREKRNPFDRSTPPLIRFHAQQRSERSFQLILSFHHVCLDGWSLAAVLTELLRDYANLLHERDSVTSSPQIGYRDFVALEIEAINSESSRSFWASRTEEAGSSQLPRWPKTFRAGGREQVRGPEIIIDRAVLAGLRTLAQRAGVPLKTVLLAAHQKVMGLLYGQSDVTSGLVCNGRPENIDGEKLVGLFLNTLPFRLKLKDSANWLNLIEETFVAEQEIIPHRRFPMAEIQRLNGGKSLFESAFDFVHFHVYQSLQHCEGIDFKEGHYFEANNLTTYTTFMLNVTSAELELHIDYDPNSIGRQQIEEMCGYYLKTLQAMVLDPLSCYDSFSPLSESERQKLLVDWNATEQPLSGSECVHEWFELRAQETPETVALVFGHERISYRELNERATRIASRLIKSKASPGRLVGIFLERSIEMVAGLLGILKAGSAYVPLDPGYPKERLAQMIDDAQLSMILTERRLLPELPDSRPPSLFVDQTSEDVAEDVPATPLKCSGDTLAYVIYTSGSTGRPKAVQIPHRAVVNALSSIAQTIGITHRDNLVAITTLSFDIAALEIFLPLMVGGTVTLASREQATDGTQLSALLHESQATIMQGTPATWRLLLESGWSGDPGLKALCGGESLSQPLAQELLPRVREVWNMYGPTETTIWSTACKVMPQESISIGRPLANTQIYIVDADLHPVPVGTLGEICIGGLGVAHGYLNRRQLTEEKFIMNPLVLPGGQRIYKTGDLGRFLPDGRIECFGRMDHQVKVRGFRIEPEEIETHLRKHDSIAEALVVTRPNVHGESALVGYIISKNGALTTRELRDFLKTRLPVHMIPSRFVTLKAFPATANGKTDRSRLPSLETDEPAADSFVPPRTEDEEKLAAIWREVLEIRQVGVHDNFFEIGGDSLSATRAFARVKRTFAANLSLRHIFEYPTISSLAEVFQTTLKRGPVITNKIIPRRHRDARAS